MVLIFINHNKQSQWSMETFKIRIHMFSRQQIQLWFRRLNETSSNTFPTELLCFVIPNILIPTIHCWVFYGIHSSHTPRIKEALSWQDPVQSPVCHEWSWHLSIECGVDCKWREFVLQFQEIEISTLHTTELFRKLWKMITGNKQ